MSRVVHPLCASSARAPVGSCWVLGDSGPGDPRRPAQHPKPDTYPNPKHEQTWYPPVWRLLNPFLHLACPNSLVLGGFWANQGPKPGTPSPLALYTRCPNSLLPTDREPTNRSHTQCPPVALEGAACQASHDGGVERGRVRPLHRRLEPPHRVLQLPHRAAPSPNTANKQLAIFMRVGPFNPMMPA